MPKTVTTVMNYNYDRSPVLGSMNMENRTKNFPVK